MAEMTVRAVPRESVVSGAWDAFVTAHPDGWFFHRETWIDYCLAYRPGAVDRSFAMVDARDRVRAVAPLVLEDGVFQMGGEPGLAPLIDARGLDAEYLLWETYCCVTGVAQASGARRVRFRTHPGAALDVNGFGYGRYAWETSVLDLRRPVDRIFRDVRKSYRYLIRRAEKQRDVVVIGKGWPLISICRSLHREAAGRETRSERTWEMMAEWCDAGDGLVALVSAPTEPTSPDIARQVIGTGWVGYAFALRWKNWAYYASGATVDQDVAHALQWALIKALHADGRTFYEIGWGARPGDDDKARGITLFKQGFGGDDWTVQAAERPV